MYIKRNISQIFQKARALFPVCVLTGARQTGKSTFLQNELKNYRYVTFDDPIQRDFATSDPAGFIQSSRNETGTVLDEIQYVPHLLQYIKMEVDRHRVPGQWILTGSQQFHLMKNIGESLAGRAVLLDLAPFCYAEIDSNDCLEEVLWKGFYPEPALHPEKRDLWISSYLQTYLERDIRQLGNIVDLHSFETIVKLCAARHGQELNMASLSRESGVAVATVKKWIALLESCYLLFLLPPFHSNLGKRVVKSPKLYFMDSALAAYLTHHPSSDSLLAGSMGGQFFEGFIVIEAVKHFFNRGKKPDLFFWRSHDGLEIDLLVQNGSMLHPVEIKKSTTPKPAFTTPLNQFRKIAEKEYRIEDGLLVCQTESPVALPHRNQAIPWRQFSSWLDAQSTPGSSSMTLDI